MKNRSRRDAETRRKEGRKEERITQRRRRRQGREVKNSDFNELTGAIVDAVFQVHYKLGPGLLECVYQKVLCYELTRRKLTHVEELAIPIRPYTRNNSSRTCVSQICDSAFSSTSAFP